MYNTYCDELFKKYYDYNRVFLYDEDTYDNNLLKFYETLTTTLTDDEITEASADAVGAARLLSDELSDIIIKISDCDI